ncbi:MAG: hypothetical protein AAGL49_13340, partial [Pseudomonadota bacterium]
MKLRLRMQAARASAAPHKLAAMFASALALTAGLAVGLTGTAKADAPLSIATPLEMGAEASAPHSTAAPGLINAGAEWRIVHTSWSEAHERGFEDFVRAIGRADCNSFDQCLESDANPYRDTDDFGSFQGDCADLPYFLRGYYAWKNGLPFSYQDEIRTADGSITDERYSANGNVIVSRYDAVTPV